MPIFTAANVKEDVMASEFHGKCPIKCTIIVCRKIVKKNYNIMLISECLYVYKSKSAIVYETIIFFPFAEWVECTAFEIAIAKYGIAMKTQHFNSKFFMGRLVKQYPEPPLHFLQSKKTLQFMPLAFEEFHFAKLTLDNSILFITICQHLF